MPAGALGYVRTLEDPYEFPPVKIGFNCLVPSILATGYMRYSFDVNADGSFSVLWKPTISDNVSVNNAGANVTPVYTGLTSSNSAAITTQMAMARVVSGGVRLFALFPQTSAPGVLVAGSTASVAFSQMTPVTPNGMMNLSSSILGIGSHGTSVTTRPTDIAATVFGSDPLTGYVNTYIPAHTTCYIGGVNFPAGTKIWLESVINLEGLPRPFTNAIGISSSDSVPRNDLLNSFPSFEQMITSVTSVLPSSVLMDAAAAVGLISPNTGRLVNKAMHAFGNHRAGRNLVAGANFAHEASRNSVTIEEFEELMS